MKTLVFATHNMDKLREISEILPLYKILSLKDIGLTQAIEENGATLEENALIKATAAFEKSGIPSLGDDTGLFTEALGGQPGIYSARYSGGSYSDNVNKLLREMKDVPEGKRGAYFACAAALVYSKGSQSVTAKVPGQITRECYGEGGFGYDPIFMEETTRLTYAQMSEELKNELSHRKKAFEMLLPYIEECLKEEDK